MLTEASVQVDENESYGMALVGQGDAPGLPVDFKVPEKEKVEQTLLIDEFIRPQG